MTLHVREDLCLGCGVCAKTCHRQAITLVGGRAVIEKHRCDLCRLCIQACPQGAIVDEVPVSKEELQATVATLRHRTAALLERIEKLTS